MNECINHSGLLTEVNNLKKSDEDQWIAINKIRERPPVWCTLVIGLLAALAGWFAK